MEITDGDDPVLDALAAVRPNQTDLYGRSLRDAVRRQLIGPVDEPFRLGRFTVLGRLGTGGMGTVFVAYDPDLDRRVALKVLHTRGERGRAAALREGRALARLRHPNVVTVHEVGVLDGQVFVVMEYVAGENLRAWARGERSRAALLERLLGAGRGLAAAHDVGLVHHDFKPENVVIDDSGQARVIDFGLAREVDELLVTQDTGDDVSPATPSLRGGTPAYMAPERLAHQTGDRRSDQFSYAVTCWELLTGERPTAADLRGDARLPGRTARALRRALAPAPADRFASMHELLDALTPASPRRWTWALLALALTTLTIVLVAALTRAPEGPRCASPWALVDETWGDARAAAIAAAFAATEAPFAGETWASVRPRLDRYASEWIDAHARACEATAVLGVAPRELYDRRVLCLEERRLHLAAVVERFAAADREVVTRAHEAVDRLPPIAACDGADAAAWSPSDEAALRERLAIREEQARASAELDTGAITAATQRLERLLERARHGDDRVLLAELHRLAGAAEDAASLYQSGKDHYREALHLAITEDQALLAAVAAIGLADVRRTLHEGDPEGDELLALADAFTRRGGDPPRVRLSLLHFQGLRQMDAHRNEEAIATFDAHRRLALESGDPLAAALSLESRALCRDALGDFAGAAADLRQSLDEVGAILGPLHPRLGRLHNNLSSMLLALGDDDGAVEHIERSMAITRANFGESHLLLGAAKINLGAIHKERGRLADALAEHQGAAAIFTALMGPHHPHVALARCASAADLRALGRLEEGLAEAEAGAAIYAETAADPGDCDPLMCAAVRGRILHDLDRHGDALALIDPLLPAVDGSSCPPPLQGEIRLLGARERWERSGGARERARVQELLAGTDAIDDPKWMAERDRLRDAVR